MHYIFLGALLALAVLSIRSIVVLNKRSPWTVGGWAASFLYCIAAAYELLTAHELLKIIPYGILAVMIAAYVIAGINDEPQAEPWYAPTRLGKTRAETRSK